VEAEALAPGAPMEAEAVEEALDDDGVETALLVPTVVWGRATIPGVRVLVVPEEPADPMFWC
jgi:hypothetical protein